MTEQKIDMILAIVSEHRKESKAMHEKHEKRIRHVESVQDQQKGAIKVVVLSGVVISAAVSAFITKLFS